MEQFILPLTNGQHCQQCLKAVTPEMALKSKKRCDGRVLCFTHQMYYTSNKYKQKRLATKPSPKTRSVSPLA